MAVRPATSCSRADELTQLIRAGTIRSWVQLRTVGMTTNFARRASASMGALALVAVLAACGSSGSSGPTTAPSAANSSAQSTPTSSPPDSNSSASAPSSPATSAATSPSAAVISIKNFAYEVPRGVKAGSKVMVKNTDQVAHTVTADSGNSLFNVTVDPGGSASFTAPAKPGSYRFHCTFHSNMHGTLVIT